MVLQGLQEGEPQREWQERLRAGSSEGWDLVVPPEAEGGVWEFQAGG